MKRSGIAKAVLPVVLFTGLAVMAQTGSDYEEWQKKEASALKQFQEARDREFASFLDREWREFQAFQGIVRDRTPKPVKPPVYTPPPPVPEMPPPTVRIPKALPLPVPAPLPEYAPPPEKRPTPVPREDVEILEFTYFGSTLNLEYDKRLRMNLGRSISKEAISAFWKALNGAAYRDCLAQAQDLKKQMKLNDWGYCQLLERIGEGIHEGARNQGVLFAWFLMSKSGYDVRIGYRDDRVYLLAPATTTMYGTPFFTFDNRRFYVVGFGGSAESVSSLYTYEGKYPGADRSLDLRVDSLPALRDSVMEKTFRFRYGDREYTLPARFSRAAVTYLERYPQTDFEVYFDSEASQDARASLVKAMKPILLGKSETESVNILLRFVQTAFQYRTDDEQFGREKYCFPDETLYYPYSDCDDRAILFAYLVRSCLGLQVVGLDFPGHVATAVRFKGAVSGDYVMHGNQKYIICDPTYILADCGVRMPQCKGVTPKIIPIHV